MTCRRLGQKYSYMFWQSYTDTLHIDLCEAKVKRKCANQHYSRHSNLQCESSLQCYCYTDILLFCILIQNNPDWSGELGHSLHQNIHVDKQHLWIKNSQITHIHKPTRQKVFKHQYRLYAGIVSTFYQQKRLRTQNMVCLFLFPEVAYLIIGISTHLHF